MSNPAEAQSLPQIASELMARAGETASGRAARTVYGGQSHDLRQTLIALMADNALGEHASPGEATLLVLQGTVTLSAGTEHWVLKEGELLVVPPQRHDLHADTDAVVLLTVATGTS